MTDAYFEGPTSPAVVEVVPAAGPLTVTVPVPPLADTDPVAEAIWWLTQRPRVLALLGGDTGRITGTGSPVSMNQPPYPRLRLSEPPGGSGRSLRWLVNTSLLIEAIGDVGGYPGPAALRRLLLAALAELALLPEADTQPGRPVVTSVGGGGIGWLPMPTGQPRYQSTVSVSLHPPNG